MIIVILAFTCSVLCALIGIPILANLARQFGLVDHPDDKRKLHTDSIPMVGGIAVYLTMVLVVPVTIFLGVRYQPFFTALGNDLLGWLPIDFARRFIRVLPDDYYELPGLLIGASILVVVGLLDDRFGIRSRQKLLGQFVATTALIVAGYQFDSILIAGFEINFGRLSVFFVYAWVLAAINSVNLLDGADGVAGTVGIVMSLALGVMAVYQGMMITAIISVTMAGALLGFLRFNFPPAKVYLGDTGSMLIGFVLSALAIRCTFKQNSAYAFFAPVALLAIPFIDTGAAIIRRRLTGRSIFAVDRGHLHHELAKQGYSPQTSLLWVALLCATTATGGVLSLIYRQSEYALVSILLVVIVMVGCRIFGLAEYQLISRKTSTMARSLMTMATRNAPEIQQSSVHVQGHRDWQESWTQLCDFADAHGLVEITLDLNAPWLHESFHATRRRSDLPRGGNHDWQSKIPLISDGRMFGRVEITGLSGTDESHHDVIKNMMAVTAKIEYAFYYLTPGTVYKLVDADEEVGDVIVDSDQNVGIDNPHQRDADLDIPDSTASKT